MPFGIFSTPNTSAQSYWPARIAPAASCRAAPPLAQPASMSTMGTPVSASAPSTLWPDSDAAVRGSAERGLELGVPRLRERGAYRVHAHVGCGLALEAAEGMNAGAGYANAHVTTPLGNSSATSVIACPNSSCAGSDSRRRVMMRSCSCTSSTTPNPYGTAPS